MADNVPLQGKIFFVARCHLLAELYLNVSRPCATCRIMETCESVQNVAPSPKKSKKHGKTTYWAALLFLCNASNSPAISVEKLLCLGSIVHAS